ncbi:hypothetical protein AVEN_94587-1 [Araneus ventricosus]|uniref:BTB domain-containing protein n=1 Tax=Araneus ventricosus TaxID=182803 RepID=A0A4Y2ILA2_ARAVE|nr:hypothetical protein AVEN_94587-1 [Araneus ventricosus]
MLNLEKANEPKFYNFSWEVIGYDCGPPKIRSPTFKVNFEVTEWYIELDLSKLQNIESCIPFRLQRIPDIGPFAVTFDIKITVTLSEAGCFTFVQSQSARMFSEKVKNYWDFDLVIPFQKLEPKDDLNWLTSKNLLIDVEFKSSEKTDPEFPQKYWYTNASLKAVLNDLKELFSSGNYTDLVLKLAGEEFKLHKCILNARWPNFMPTLEIGIPSAVVETKEFSGMSPGMLKGLLEFAYYGNLDFMNQLHEMDDGLEVFSLVRIYNFYRLNDRISQLSPKCSSSQILQSYRTSVEMKFTNVTSTEKAMGDFRTCEIHLKPRKLPRSDKPMDEREREKFQQHIRFMDLRLYVDKGPLGYNWLMFSVVLGKIPQENPVTIKCKLYVVVESEVKYLLTEQNLVFDQSTEISFTTPFSKGKISKRYRKISEPVITWEELTEERNNFMRKRLMTKPSRTLFQGKSEQIESSEKTVEEKDICFRFELKLADGEHLHDIRHDESIFMYEFDYKIFQDLELVHNDDKFTDIVVYSGDRNMKAHKAILAARSTKISEDILRSKENSKVLEIKIEPEYLHMFIRYLYTGQIQEVPVHKIDHLLSVANEYGLNCLKDVLEKHRPKQADVA